MVARESPGEAAAILAGLGAHEDCITAARLLAEGAPRDERGGALEKARTLAAAALRALKIRWVQGGRTPASHAIEAVIALAGGHEALLVATAAALARLRGAEQDPSRGPPLASEALAVWAPVAAHVHLRPLQRELEDLAFKIVDRSAYDAVAHFVALRREDRDRAVEAARTALGAALREAGIEAEITGRAKHLWSIHQKLRARGDRSPRIYDVFALRVTVGDEARCYEALGAVHAAFPSLPERFKDYIAKPKSNGYRSLHTVVRIAAALPDWLEVQIRSRAMHALAEHGAAAHVRYKYRDAPGHDAGDGRFTYALTPSGEVRRLPRGATPLDFAYAVHTKLGWGYTGAKVNGRMATIATPLRTGDVVEILHSARARPSEGQLGRVRTARARNRIRAALPLATGSLEPQRMRARR